MMATLPGVRYRVLVHIPNTLFDDQGKDPSPYHAAQLDIGDLLTTSRQDKDAARVLLYHIFAERIFMLTLTDSDKDPHEEALKKEAKFMSRLTGKDEGKQALHCYNKETGEFFMTFRSTQFRLHVTTGIFGLQNADIDTVRRIETDAEWLANLQDHECPAGWH
jgi:hypothetical protein